MTMPSLHFRNFSRPILTARWRTTPNTGWARPTMSTNPSRKPRRPFSAWRQISAIAQGARCAFQDRLLPLRDQTVAKAMKCSLKLSRDSPTRLPVNWRSTPRENGDRETLSDHAVKSERLRINEIFHSLQGEADSVGFPTVFVRLTGCPLRCQYCDTEYAFHAGDWLDLDSVLSGARVDATHVCVTGGEPLAQPNCLVLLERLCAAGFKVSLETSGAMSSRRSIRGCRASSM